jgi:regulator of replication initiation timing
MSDIIAEINSMVTRLISERDALKQQLVDRATENQQLRSQVNGLNARLDALDDTNRTLKIAKSLTGSGENTDAKLKINELVREIDKCIALLNK